jgi:phage tail-like protein
MRDANGSRFELLLGKGDWGRCTTRDALGAPITLSESWKPGSTPLLSFDESTQRLMLTRRVSRFRAARTDTPPDATRRLGAVADRWGNVYWIAAPGADIRVLSAGSRNASSYARSDAVATAPAAPAGGFAPLRASAPALPRRLLGLTITSEQYLVAGVLPEGAQSGGLKVFDLMAGGPGLDLRWPADWPFAPFDLAPRCCGGIAVLDRTHQRVWMLDRRLGMRGAPVPSWFALRVDDTGGADPVAIEVLDDGAVLVMDGAGPEGFALLSLYVDGVLAGRSTTRVVLDVIDADERDGFALRGYDCALVATAEQQPARVIIAADDGNQCFAFDLLRDAGGLTLQPQDECYPMRRFGGQGLVRRTCSVDALWASQDTGVLYDASGTWVPLVAQRRPRFAPYAVLETFPLDSDQPHCVWHRLMIDGSVPPGSRLRIETRAADDLDALSSASYRAEPQPILRAQGSELPYLRGVPTSTDATRGRGTWKLLFQAARGRYLQLRVTLEGDELNTPRLFALRAWSPRFSYAQRYLPGVYREDESSADFLERFLANFEGMFTELEDRIAAVSALFDLRSAPAELLDWLASWLGLVLDPNVDEQRKRLLIRFALPLYAYRGTTQGLRLGSELVLAQCVRPEDFTLPARSQRQPYGIRIVERYLTRQLPPGLLGETVIDAPRLVAQSARWSSSEGAEGLSRRYRTALQQAGVAGADSKAYTPLRPTAPEELAVWRSFSADTLGSVPQLADALVTRWRAYLASLAPEQRFGMTDALPRTWPADEDQRALWQAFLRAGLPAELRRWLARWQGFLARRYLRMDAFSNAWGGSWPEMALVPAPDFVPTGSAALRDWALFETRLEPMAQAAHRFSVLLPSRGPNEPAEQIAQRNAFARRVVELEKPAHTVFDVRSYWALFRIGQTRLGLDSLLGLGSRDPALAPTMIIGAGHIGASRVAPQAETPRGRIPLPC